MDEDDVIRVDGLVAAVQALAEAGVPTDIQELLLYGNPSRGVGPRALERAIAAANKARDLHKSHEK